MRRCLTVVAPGRDAACIASQPKGWSTLRRRLECTPASTVPRLCRESLSHAHAIHQDIHLEPAYLPRSGYPRAWRMSTKALGQFVSRGCSWECHTGGRLRKLPAGSIRPSKTDLAMPSMASILSFVAWIAADILASASLGSAIATSYSSC